MREFEKDWEIALEYNRKFYTINVQNDLVGTVYYRHWQVQLDINVLGKVHEFTVNIPIEGKNEEFPLTLPKIYISENDKKSVKNLPNIDSNGLICTFDPVTTRSNVNHPGEIIRECLEKAKDIIKNGLEGTNKENYNEEFLAYWNSGYEAIKKNSLFISTINEETCEPTKPKLHKINPPINGVYDYLLSSEENNIENLLNHLKSRFNFNEVKSFFVGELLFDKPPFVLTNRQSLDILFNSKPEIKDELIKYLNKPSSSYPIIIFKKIINGKNIYLGWKYSYTKNHNGFRKGTLTPYYILYNLEANKNVTGLTPEIFTSERLEFRSLKLNEEEKTKELIVSIVGLGSIGSNLIPFLQSTRINEFRLIDTGKLQIENLGRHFLGFDSIENNKATAIANYLQKINPYYKILSKKESIVKILSEDPKFINDCDYIFICIGNSNIEDWIDKQRKNKSLNRPLFYIWVEPYLAGGHCLFIPPNSKIGFSDMFIDNYYKKNIIDKSEYDKGNLHSREAGCQTTFVQYSHTNVILFLSALYPKLLEIISNKIDKPKVFSWIGDLKFLNDLKLKLSGDYQSGAIIEEEME